MNQGSIKPADAVPAETIADGQGASMQVLVGPKDGAPNFVTRRFRLEPGGYIKKHRHPDIEHEQYVLRGRMILGIGDSEREVGPGDAIYIPARTPHWYKNPGPEPVEFLCVVPRADRYVRELLED